MKPLGAESICSWRGCLNICRQGKLGNSLEDPWRSGPTLETDGRRPLEQNGLEATHAVHTSGFWMYKGTSPNLNEDGLGNKGNPGGQAITGKDGRKSVPDPEET